MVYGKLQVYAIPHPESGTITIVAAGAGETETKTIEMTTAAAEDLLGSLQRQIEYNRLITRIRNKVKGKQKS